MELAEFGNVPIYVHPVLYRRELALSKSKNVIKRLKRIYGKYS